MAAPARNGIPLADASTAPAAGAAVETRDLSMTWDSTTATRRLAGLPEPEPLHPELAACVVRRPGRLAALEHPLIVQAPYIPPLASYVNGLFETLRERARALLDSGAFHQWIELHAARFRLQVLLENAARVDHGAYWELVATLYRAEQPACDSPEGRWLAALTAERPQRQRFMTQDERLLWARLPDTVEVWRIVPDDRPQAAFAHFPSAEAARTAAHAALLQNDPPAGRFVLVRGSLARTSVLALVRVGEHAQLLALPGMATGERSLGPAV